MVTKSVIIHNKFSCHVFTFILVEEKWRSHSAFPLWLVIVNGGRWAVRCELLHRIEFKALLVSHQLLCKMEVCCMVANGSIGRIFSWFNFIARHLIKWMKSYFNKKTTQLAFQINLSLSTSIGIDFTSMKANTMNFTSTWFFSELINPTEWAKSRGSSGMFCSGFTIFYACLCGRVENSYILR